MLIKFADYTALDAIVIVLENRNKNRRYLGKEMN